jgi:hypothetical protein
MQNSFGMEMIECKRGTNRTEGYHKNIITSFGTWHVGMEMSDCLLRERRHRHNMMGYLITKQKYKIICGGLP